MNKFEAMKKRQAALKTSCIAELIEEELAKDEIIDLTDEIIDTPITKFYRIKCDYCQSSWLSVVSANICQCCGKINKGF